MFELHIYSPSTCFLQPPEGGTTIRATSHPGTKQYKTTYLECSACHAMSRPISSAKRLV